MAVRAKSNRISYFISTALLFGDYMMKLDFMLNFTYAAAPTDIAEEFVNLILIKTHSPPWT
jgi:hypothetical protein